MNRHPDPIRRMQHALEEMDRPDPSRVRIVERVRAFQALQMGDQDDPPPPEREASAVRPNSAG